MSQGALTEKIRKILDGEGASPSPMAGIAKVLLLGTRLNELVAFVGGTGIIIADTISELTSGHGLLIDSLLIKDGKVDLDGLAGALILDADGDTHIGASTDDEIDITVNGALDFKILANVFRALAGSSLQTNSIDETTGANGILIDGVRCKDGTLQGTVGASTAAAGSATGDAGLLPAATGRVYPVTASDDTTGVRMHASDNVTGREILIANLVSNKIMKVYPPTGGTINGGAANAAFSSVSGKGVVVACVDSAANGGAGAFAAW